MADAQAKMSHQMREAEHPVRRTVCTPWAQALARFGAHHEIHDALAGVAETRERLRPGRAHSSAHGVLSFAHLMGHLSLCIRHVAPPVACRSMAHSGHAGARRYIQGKIGAHTTGSGFAGAIPEGGGKRPWRSYICRHPTRMTL